MTLKINDKDVELKIKTRTYMLYENITNKSFEPTTMTDIINFLYCVILTSSNDYDYKYNDLLDFLDEDPMILPNFCNWLEGEYKRQAMMTNDSLIKDNSSDDSKKK